MVLKNGSPDVNSKMGDNGSFSMDMNENRKKNSCRNLKNSGPTVTFSGFHVRFRRELSSRGGGGLI